MRARHTLRIFLVTTVLCLLSFVGFNLAVDPYGMVNQLSVAAKGELRLCGQGERRIIKSLQLAKGNWDGLVLGSSRIEWGFDPDLPAMREMRLYNGGLPVMTSTELEAILAYARRTAEPQLIIVDMDPITFARLGGDQGVKDFNQSPFGGTSRFSVLAGYLLSLRTTRDAWLWLAWPLKSHKDVCKLDGARYMGMRNVRVDHRANFDKILSASFRKQTYSSRYSSIEDAERRMRSFVDKLRFAARDGVFVYLFLPPVHAVVQEHVSRFGWHENIQRYRRHLVEAVDEANRKISLPPRKRSATPIRLWDFSGYNEMTTEPIPGLQSPEGSKMLWYYDPFHLTPRAMQAMYCTMRDRTPLGCAFAELKAVGKELSGANIEAHETMEAHARSGYLSSHPEVSDYLRARAAVAAEEAEEIE